MSEPRLREARVALGMAWGIGSHPETEIIGASLFLARSLGERPVKNSQMFITRPKNPQGMLGMGIPAPQSQLHGLVQPLRVGFEAFGGLKAMSSKDLLKLNPHHQRVA